LIDLLVKTKKCVQCEVELPMTNEYFGKSKNLKDGFRNECKKCTSMYLRKYKQDRPEAIAESRSNYKQNNGPTILNSQKKYRDNNKDPIKKFSALHRKNHPEQYRINNHNRKARIRNLPHTLTVAQWEDIKLHFDNKCSFCGKEASLTHEHFVAVTKDGEYTRDNIIPSCMSCNRNKSTSSYFDWYPKQPFYTKARESKILKHLGYKNEEQQLSIF